MNLPFRSFRDREYCFLLSLFSSKKTLETKAVWTKHFRFPSVILSMERKQSTKSSLESRCFDIFCFFAEILEKHQRIILFFHISASWRPTLLLQRLLKSQVVTKCFSLILSWELCRATISKKHLFFQHSLSSYICRLYCWLLHYCIIALWINLLSSVCAYTLKIAFPNLLKLAY